MIVIDFIIELLLWIFVELIFKGLLVGTWKIIRKVSGRANRKKKAV